jgi:pyruvate formate lyase activating enzyme
MAEPISGLVFDLKRMSVNDGPGIRTTVFLKGCPLRCLWCHNPESQRAGIELSATCPDPDAATARAVRAFNRRPAAERDAPGLAEAAAAAMPGRVETVGRWLAVPEVLEKVLEDRAFFERSGGGATLSGGEPLAQPEFALALLRAFREAGIHTLLDTCGAAAAGTLLESVRWTDLYHYDIKETRPENHRRLTGAPLGPVLENLARLDAAGAAIILRCPVIPGFNDGPEHLRALGSLAGRHVGVRQIELMPYHDIGLAKYARLGRRPPLPLRAGPDDATVDGWIARVREETAKPVVRG